MVSWDRERQREQQVGPGDAECEWGWETGGQASEGGDASVVGLGGGHSYRPPACMEGIPPGDH